MWQRTETLFSPWEKKTFSWCLLRICLLVRIELLKVNYFPHQMAITLTEKGHSGKRARKAEQETSITPERGVDYGVGTVPAANAVLSGV
jgi:hypothetical protein